MNAPARPWPALSLQEATARLTAPGSPFEIEEQVIAGVPMRVWRHAPPTLREVFLAGAAHGDRIFLVHESDRVTFSAFACAAAGLAHTLIAAGLARGDRVAIAMRNRPEWPVSFFGSILAGAIAVPLNAWWTGPELAFALNDSGATIAIMDSERWERLKPVRSTCPALQRVIVAGPLPPEEASVLRLEDRIGPPASWGALSEPALPDLPLAPDDDATIFYTSGTTGRPKGALGTHRNSTSAIMGRAFSFARTQLRRGDAAPAPEPQPAKATLLAIPLFHVTGCQAIQLNALYRGHKLVLMRRWDPEEAIRLIARERCTYIGGVPTIAAQIIEHPARLHHDLSCIESVSYGGAPAAPDLVRRIREAWPKAAPGNGWGMTETSSTFTHHQGEDYERRPDSCGPALPVCDMKVVGPDARGLPAGEVGELWVKGPMVVRGYWNNPQATAEAFADGWLRTGDLGRIDDEGFLTIVDRLKDLIIRGGENIYCAEIENVLCDHPAVMDAAVIAIPHPSLGEEPAAIVSLRPGSEATAAELLAFAGSRLARFKLPVRLVVWPEPLPRNPGGKILKSALKACWGPPATA